LLGFPALAGQEYGAWNLVLATGVVSHLTPGEPERLQVEKIDSLRSLVKVLGRERSWAAVPGIDDSATLANTSLWYSYLGIPTFATTG
jgi:hypothetical protein